MKRSILIVLTSLALTACDNNTAQAVLGLVSSIVSTSGQPVSETELLTYNGEDQTQQMELPAVRLGDDIITYSGYVSSYNHKTLIPDWVAYELTAEELEGDEQRGERMFSMDKNVKGKQAMREDYRDSGWTKGHMAPATDFRWSADAMDETFYFMNVCPQNEHLNGEDWEYLEGKVRHWARQYGKVWVVSGPIVGSGKYGTIGDDHVVVPDSFYKTVMYCKGGRYHTIAFVMGNDDNRYWLQDCAVSVNDLEALTGIDFFPALDDSIEDSVEAQLTLSDWGI